VQKERQRSERYKGRGMGMKRKIFAVLLMLVLGMTCVACDMGAVETGSSNVTVSMDGEAEEKAEATSTPIPTIAPTNIPSPTELPTPTTALTSTLTPSPVPTLAGLPKIAPRPMENPVVDVMVWLPATGEKYHNKNNCGRMNPDKARQVTKSEAERLGYEPCGRCY